MRHDDPTSTADLIGSQLPCAGRLLSGIAIHDDFQACHFCPTSFLFYLEIPWACPLW
jgi:hypothetical protein